MIADIPADPRTTEPWPFAPVYSGEAGERGDQSGSFKYAEGTGAADIDGDGVVDLLAGNYWFKYLGDGKFKPVRVGAIGGRICAGKFVESSKYPQIVIAPGDGSGPLRWYECAGDPLNEADWKGHDLLDRGRTQDDHQQGGQHQEHQREGELDAGLAGQLLGALASPGPHRVRVGAQRLPDAAAETVGLNQHGNKRACAFETCSCREWPKD